MTERRVPEPMGSYGVARPGRWNPADRVRWSAVVAGLAAALATMILLSVLGLAIGLTTYNTGESAQPYRTAAGIWAIVSMIVAFFIGGLVASRTAVATGDSGLLNGTMVWATAIPIILLMIASGATSVLSSMAGGTAGERVIRAAAQIPGAESPPGAQPQEGQPPTPAPVQPEEARRTASSAAWWTLATLLLGLGASALGGWAGQRRPRDEHMTTTTTTTTP